MTVLVTGGSGQLAAALAAHPGMAVIGRPGFDFDRPETITPALAAARPTLVVNAAAYTAVDAAETDAAAAFRANRDGPAAIAAWCRDAGVPLIHISTDYVFDGTKGAPYLETDPAAPLGVYGASKHAGERAVLESGARAVILRTSWVYASRGRNFMLTMLSAGARMPRLRVVADQIGCPTTALDLAAAVAAVAGRIAAGWREEYAGITHAAGSGHSSWHGFATAIFAEAAAFGGPTPEVEAIATADWPTPVRRPADSRLDCTRLDGVFGVRLPDWRDGLRRTVAAWAAARTRR
ncbi:MAG: dTDP-4-dehydrorhamnose reductase [Acetobacteraceae bacterium]